MLGAKFLQVYPLGTISAVIISFLGQLALIASFLLPLKIVMLMGTNGLPEILPSTIIKIEKQSLIVILSTLTVAVYVFYEVATKLTSTIAKIGTERLKKRNQKLDLFENQDSLMATAYSRYLESVAGLVFFIAGTSALALIYPDIVITIISFISLCLIGYGLIWNISQKLHDSISERLPKQLNTLSGVGFFCVFIWIVIDYIFFSIPEFITIILTIIMGRQLLSKLTAAILGINFLIRQKPKLDALLFHSRVFQNPKPRKNTVWDFLEDRDFNAELANITKNTAGYSKGSVEFSWHESGIPNIICIETKLKDKRFLLKIFDRAKSSEARHEATILLEGINNLPSPPLIGTHQSFGHQIHVFCIDGYNFDLGMPIQSAQNSLKKELSKTKLTNSLVSKYKRSRLMLWDRINYASFRELRIIQPENKLLDQACEIICNLTNELHKLPLVPVNPTLTPSTLVKHADGSIHSIHWGKWSIEPKGAGWPIIKSLPSPLTTQKLEAMAALLFKLEHELKTQKFSMALQSVDLILTLYHELNKSSDKELY